MKNRTKIIAALGFLVAVSSALSAELKNLIQPLDGSEIKVRLTRHTMYVRKHATNASSAWALIDENTKKVDGVSSISETKLPKNQAVIFDRVAVGFAEGTAEGQEGELDYTATKAPAVLRNANLVVTQNGREVIDLPVADLVKTISPGNPEDYYHDLEAFNYLVDDMPMEIVFRFPNGKTLAPSAAGKFNYLELRFQGYKTSRKQ